MIDAAHGFRNGTPHGSTGLNGISEDELVLAIAKKIEQVNTDRNLKLVFTRKDKNYVDKVERAKITEENNADLFISIHANFVPQLRDGEKRFENPANGFELYVPKEGNANFRKSKELGSAIINEAKNFMTVREPGIKQRTKGVWVLDTISCPAILIECGFISNPKDLAFLTDEKNQEKIAEAILKGIVNYAATSGKLASGNTVVADTIPLQNKGATTQASDSIEKRKDVTKIPAGTPIFTKAEIMPEFQGGSNSWNKYMEKVIKENIDALIAEGKEGQCDVEFIVTPEGYVGNVRVKTMQNTKLASVLVEAIKTGPKWIPAIQNGRKVYCATAQRITFRLPPSTNIQPISIANAHMKNLYIGIDNPLVMSIGSTPGSQLQVTSNNGTVTKVNGSWVAKPSFEGKVTITITDPKTKQEAKVIFTVKQLAVPAITLGHSKNGGRIAAHKITESKQLAVDEIGK